MKYNKQYLYNAYNATSTDDGKGDIETYESWLERQLISRIKKIDELEKNLKPNELRAVNRNEAVKEFINSLLDDIHNINPELSQERTKQFHKLNL